MAHFEDLNSVHAWYECPRESNRLWIFRKCPTKSKLRLLAGSLRNVMGAERCHACCISNVMYGVLERYTRNKKQHNAIGKKGRRPLRWLLLTKKPFPCDERKTLQHRDIVGCDPKIVTVFVFAEVFDPNGFIVDKNASRFLWPQKFVSLLTFLSGRMVEQRLLCISNWMWAVFI